MTKKQAFVWCCLAAGAVVWSHCSRSPAAQPRLPQQGSIAYLEQPRVAPGETVLYNVVGRYSFVYDPDHRQARWVAYKLTASDLGDAGRSSSGFRVDPRIGRQGWICAVDDDYRGSGYDRGHLLPSGDRTRTAQENRETFLFSNASPQLHYLNGGIWRVLEEELRSRTAWYDTLYIVVGGAIEPGRDYPTIGSGVAVPELFYKVVANRRGDDFEQEAYVMPNAAQNKGKYHLHRVPVDSVERLTGLDFFPLIDQKK